MVKLMLYSNKKVAFLKHDIEKQSNNEFKISMLKNQITTVSYC